MSLLGQAGLANALGGLGGGGLGGWAGSPSDPFDQRQFQIARGQMQQMPPRIIVSEEADAAYWKSKQPKMTVCEELQKETDEWLADVG